MHPLWKRRSGKSRETEKWNTKVQVPKMQKKFQTEYVNKGALPETKRMIIKMSVNGSGIRDTARVLGISKDTVMKH